MIARHRAAATPWGTWLAIAMALAAGCDEAPTGPCDGSRERSVTIGSGTGPDFVPYDDYDDIAVAQVPQGGLGLPVVLRTVGLHATWDTRATVTFSIFSTASPPDHYGTFSSQVLIRCLDGLGGQIFGVAAGYDPDEYVTIQDLHDKVPGDVVKITVEVADTRGRTASSDLLVSQTLPPSP